MLETIREFATARLGEDPELQAVAQRAHAAFYADFTGQQWEQLRGDGREAALGALTTELENVHCAWRHWVGEGDLGQLSKLTDSLWLLYDARGWYHAAVGLTTDLLRVLAATVSTPERAREEIMLQTSLARALWVTRGFTEEVEQAYARVLELCERTGEIPQFFPVLRSLALYYELHAEPEKGIQLGQRILDLAERLGDTSMKAEGHLVIGPLIAVLMDIHAGLEHLEKGLSGLDVNRMRARRFGLGSNLGVVGLTVSALLLWMIGYPERALRRASESIALAQQLDHPFTLCYALFHCGLLNLWMGNLEVAQEWTREAVDLADSHEFPVWSAVASCVRGAAMVGMGAKDEGLALLQRHMQVYRGLKSPIIFWPNLLHMLASAYGAASRPADGLPLIDSAIQIVSSDSGSTLAAEFLRLKGDLLLSISQDNAAEAEAWLQQAVNAAQEAQAPMFELRAVLPLSRLWHSQGKTEAARSLLGAAYAKMTEGFALPDLMQARALLEELTPD
jgi:adenylate cyclase